MIIKIASGNSYFSTCPVFKMAYLTRSDTAACGAVLRAGPYWPDLYKQKLGLGCTHSPD